MKALLKSLAAKLPLSAQQELKRYYFALQIRRGRFFSDEKEFELAHQFLGAGDWVLDIGANVGHYTRRFSDLVGPTGRVIAFEPVPRTFELLSANVQLFANKNVTLMNAAASDACGMVGMQIPTFESALSNYYQAHISGGHSDVQVMTLAVDSMALPHAVKLIKIDAEGHEPAVLQGMRNLLARDRPLLVVEDNSRTIGDFLEPLGYVAEQLDGSSNLIFRPRR
jgi:FkbM family methyltransferase